MLWSVVVVVICAIAQPVEPMEWSSVTAGATTPSARRDMALGYFQTQNKLVVFGGRGGPITDDTWEFDIGTGKHRSHRDNSILRIIIKQIQPII